MGNLPMGDRLANINIAVGKGMVSHASENDRNSETCMHFLINRFQADLLQDISTMELREGRS